MIADRANFNRVVLFPGMSFTCNGTIARVTLAGWPQKAQDHPRIRLILGIWRENNGFQYHSEENISLPSACENRMWSKNDRDFAVLEDDGHANCILHDCLLDRRENSFSVWPGDIIGIKLMSGDVIDWIYFTESKS